MSEDVRELLASPKKRLSRSKGILCFLFRTALIWCGMNQFSWNKRMRLYMEKPHNKGKADRGNMNKQLTKDEFTWAVFKKAIDFLNPKGAVLSITLTWRSGLKSTYSLVIDPAEDESDSTIDTLSEDIPSSDVFDDKAVPTSALARLYRRIICEEQIDVVKWESLCETWATDPQNGIEQNRTEINKAIKEFQRAIFDPRVSWNTFRRGLLLLRPKEMEFSLELRWSDKPGDVSVHTVTNYDPLAIAPPLSDLM